jgi:hypothetical protein
MNSPSLPAPPRKSGLGCFTQLVLVVVAVFVAIIGVNVVFAPWSFYMGGNFHVVPQWQGWGLLHSRIAGDYVLYVNFWPRPGGRGSRGRPHVSGTGVLCTPRGEKYNMHVGADFDKASGKDLQGKSAHIYMSHRTVFRSGSAPSLEFRGKWDNPDLVLDDHGSINRAFDPDGSLARNTHMRPYIQEVVPLTLHEGSHSDFDAACAALKTR